ncbi:hypothetical protein VaNZ11_001137 [Volvox africanus]|uniref:Uncharacterized protein n=1 Tax=Volvox africanus TaxID=51714 RepID=A0ABQ5RP21_9CHLO|nr:hypothetical protein VaNZ11_001137 [Volvox africanus]
MRWSQVTPGIAFSDLIVLLMKSSKDTGFFIVLISLLGVQGHADAPENYPPDQPPASKPIPNGPSSRGGGASLPQFYMNFGKCGHDLQKQEYGRWNLTRSMSKQRDPQSVILYVDTKGVFPVAPIFGTIEPRVFMIRQLHLAYFQKRGIAAWSPSLDKTPYRETTSFYTIRVNGAKPTLPARDLKDTGVMTSHTYAYSLKVILNDLITPSNSIYEVEVVKSCALKRGGANDSACAQVPDPASVFVSREGYIAYSFWNVGQSLTVDGVYARDHAWCPVQTGVTVD